MVYDWAIARQEPTTYASSLMLSPGGKLTIVCRSIEIVEG